MNALLSTQIGHLIDEFRSALFAPDVSIAADISVAARGHWLLRLAACRDLARSLEIEVEAFRALERDRKGREFLEREVTGGLRAAPRIEDGNVFRPDFGRKS